MVTLTGSKNLNELNLVVDGGTEYFLIRRALEVFRDLRAEEMNPEQRLLDVICDGDAMRIEARELLASLHDQEKEIPAFQHARLELGADTN